MARTALLLAAWLLGMISPSNPQQLAGANINCRSHQDPTGAMLKHTEGRRLPCAGLLEGDQCSYNHSLPLTPGQVELTAGCCIQETPSGVASGILFCSSLRSKVASTGASTTAEMLGLEYRCQGGAFHKGGPPGGGRRLKDCSAWEEWQGYALCTGEGGCKCMRGGEQDPEYGCTCQPPNTGAACWGQGDCSNGGMCEGVSTFAEPYVVSSGTLEDVTVVTSKDGLPVLHPKQPSWFGDELPGERIQKQDEYVWMHASLESSGGGGAQGTTTWVGYSPLNERALEEAYQAGSDLAVVQFSEFAWGDARVSLTEMVQWDASGRRVKVRRMSRMSGGRDSGEKSAATSTESLGSEESLRRKTFSP